MTLIFRSTCLRGWKFLLLSDEIDISPIVAYSLNELIFRSLTFFNPTAFSLITVNYFI